MFIVFFDSFNHMHTYTHIFTFHPTSIKKANSFQWAVHFSAEKFSSTFDQIRGRDIPSTDVMLFYYCSTVDAISARKSGVRTQKKFNGIPFSLRQPHQTKSNDFKVFSSGKRTSSNHTFPNEEVLVLSLPREFIDPLPGYEGDHGLWYISAAVLKSFKPHSFVRVAENSPWLEKVVLLPPHCIVQSFVILEDITQFETSFDISQAILDNDCGKGDGDDATLSSSNSDMNSSAIGTREGHASGDTSIDSDFNSSSSVGANNTTDHHPNHGDIHKNSGLQIECLPSVEMLSSRMKTIRCIANQMRLVPLYHYTSSVAASLIVRNGFRMNEFHQTMSSPLQQALGDLDSGIHFTTHGPACYNLGSEDYGLNIARDFYGIDYVRRFQSSLWDDRFDTVIVYGCCPRALHKVRENCCCIDIDLSRLTLLLLLHNAYFIIFSDDLLLTCKLPALNTH
jgi:hypothetical protein